MNFSAWLKRFSILVVIGGIVSGACYINLQEEESMCPIIYSYQEVVNVLDNLDDQALCILMLMIH